ncbi:MFS transporter, partial [Klebsiella pneumoniae]|uniref:MFS transporter n=1 Tax=Klebsiella pneumoniae TaxID=573 RepID=UPI00272F5BF1
ADRNRSHWSTSKTPSYTKSVSWQHHPATVYLIGFQFSKSFSSIFLSTGIGHMYQSMGFTSSYIVLGGIALCFTLISFITLDKARVFSSQPVPAN